MAFASPPRWSLRLERVELSRLARAFAISLVVHLVVAGVYYEGKKHHVWENLRWPAWLAPVQRLAQKLQAKPVPLPPQKSPDIPLVFVEVTPAQAAAEPPKDAKYYSSRNSRAANPDAQQETGTPKITGEQTQVARTQDVPREQPPQPLQPTPPAPPAPPAPAPQEEMRPKPAVTPGDLALAKPDPKPKPEPAPKKEDGQDTRSRPRTIREALARQAPNRVPGQKMKQEGGVRRRAEISSLDARATPFGEYDAVLIDVISTRWYDLLDRRDYASDGTGKVVLQFRLHYDGRITDMHVVENTVNEVLGLICQKAVLDPAPFAPWPSDMRRLFGQTRNVQFTFYYN